ncbi:WPP domain-containing protein 1-like [Miscanthus floridulus]|uniref:WPP domain-containing protein 1-like n=1 Tax=Miscanthus floridulus TaxID=154761 RepID=UPI0034599BF7
MAEDAPNAIVEGSTPTTPEGSVDATSAGAASVKATNVLLPSLSIWPSSQHMRDTVVRRLMQTLVAPSVLSQHYGVVPKPDAERAAVAVEAEAFAATSKSVVIESSACIEEGYRSSPPVVSWSPTYVFKKCFIWMLPMLQ